MTTMTTHFTYQDWLEPDCDDPTVKDLVQLAIEATTEYQLIFDFDGTIYLVEDNGKEYEVADTFATLDELIEEFDLDY